MSTIKYEAVKVNLGLTDEDGNTIVFAPIRQADGTYSLVGKQSTNHQAGYTPESERSEDGVIQRKQVNEEPAKKATPLITMEGYGRGSHLKICGIDISQALSRCELGSHATIVNGCPHNNLLIEVDAYMLLEIIKNLTEEELANAKEILAPYIGKEQP